MAIALVLLALALAANVVLGPLGLGWLQWRLSLIGLNQTLGMDGVMLVLGVPVTLAAAWLWQRGHRLAAPLALGTALFALYYGVAETIGPDYIRYAGNTERFFLLFLVIIVLSWTIAFRAWGALDPDPRVPPVWLARGLALVLAAGGLALGCAWLRQLVEIAVSGTLSEAYVDAPHGFWIVRIVDLGFLVPVCLGTAFGLWRGRPLAIKAAYGLTVFLTLQAAAVLAMGYLMLWRQDPTATPELVYVLTPITLALGALAARLLASTEPSSYPRKAPLCSLERGAGVFGPGKP